MPATLSYRGVCYRLFIALHKWHRNEEAMGANKLSQNLVVADVHPDHGPWDDILPALTLPEDRRVIRLWFLLAQTERERDEWKAKYLDVGDDVRAEGVRLGLELEAITHQRDAALALLERPMPPGYWISCLVCLRRCARRADGGPLPKKPGYGHADGCPVPGLRKEVKQP